ncbi:MAG: glycosyltransferase family 2 protein [Selenomonadaceae bacterium]|nr:glycosyltransferase family 2 protein [Selenomonadaceae bacterium]
MLISACVIVKNEEKNLPAWLDGVKNIADEIIVVDTGSTDKTVEIAEKAKVNLYRFEWIHDFAAAKNFALSKAKGDWIIFLDADEYFDKPARKKIKPLLKKLSKEKRATVISTPILSVDTDNNNAPINKATQERIFSNSPLLKYTGAIHEYLQYTGDTPLLLLEYELLIIHTGYSASIIDSKQKRNLEILLEEEKRSGDNPEHYGYIAAGYQARGDLKKANEYIEKAIDYMRPLNHPYLVNAYTFYVNVKKNMGATADELSKIVENGLEVLPDHPDILAEKLILLLEAGDFEKSEETARKIIERAKDQKLRKAYINKTDAHLPYAHYVLGLMLKRKGEKDEAAREFKIALKTYRFRIDIARELVAMYEDEPKKAAKFLTEIYDEKDDAEILANIFAELPRDALFKRFCPNLKGTFDYALAAGNFVAAVKLAAAEFDKALIDAKQSSDKSKLKEAMYKLSIAFLFLPIEDLGKVQNELAKLPNSAVALILRYHGEDLPPVQGERESFNALCETAQIYLPKKLREKFFALKGKI